MLITFRWDIRGAFGPTDLSEHLEVSFYELSRAGGSTKNLVGQFLSIVFQLSKTGRAGYSKSLKKTMSFQEHDLAKSKKHELL